MNGAFVDTDVLIRLLTRDDVHKQAAAAALLRQVEAGALTLDAPDTVIADAVYVLASPRLYAIPRAEVRELLAPLVRLPGFRVRNRRAVLRALDLYATHSVDFGDAMVAATMELARASILYAYDHDFDHISGITRLEPEVV